MIPYDCPAKSIFNIILPKIITNKLKKTANFAIRQLSSAKNGKKRINSLDDALGNLKRT